MSSERNLLFALLAVRLHLLQWEDVRALWPRWQAQPGREFADLLIESGRLPADAKVHIEYLLEHTLQKHHGDAAAGVATFLPEGQWQALMETRSPFNEESAVTPLAADDAAPNALPFAATLMGTPPPLAHSQAGDGEMPRFARVRLHATGGMGRVWLARDQRLERDVALKELRPELGSHSDVGRRFLREARITGRLEHPGIVPIHELLREGGGAAYVMRFLQGRTLSEAIKAYHEKDKADVPVLERAALLQVFVTVCTTVAFAHSRGVVHRDLKGQNVLLGAFGEVVVLDWGLAKEVAQPEQAAHGDDAGDLASLPSSLEPRDAGQTLPGQIMGTPYYMSPEQAAGATASIDERSDVYSLGAILYEILTAQAPFADQSRVHEEKSVQALLRRILEEPPTPPRQLATAVPAPLQAICLRALAKLPADRYQSAGELAQEVQCWLADEPVKAHADPLTVRLGRWARRHRTMVTSLGVLLAAAVVGLATTTLLINQEKSRTERARAKAVRNFNKAQEAVDRYFTQVSEDRLLNEPGMAALRKELLGSARDFYEDFAREHQGDAASREALGEAQLKLARITRAMGERQQALKILEEAQGQFQQLVRDHPDVDSYELGLGQSYRDLGYQSFLLNGRSPQAEADLLKARDILTALVSKNPSRLNRDELAHAHNSIGSYHANFYKVEDKTATAEITRQTEEAYLSAVALWKQLAAEEPEAPARLQDLAGGYTNLAIFYANLQQSGQSKDYLEKAMTLRRQLAERYPQSPGYQENLAAGYNNFGVYYREQNQLDQAEQAFHEAATIREKLVRENCQVVQFQQGLAKCNFNLGNLYYVEVTAATGAKRASLLTKGKQAYQRAVDISKRLHEEHPEEHQLRLEYGITLAAMGDLLTEEKQALAIPWYDRAIAELAEALRQGEKAPIVRRSLRNSYWGRAEARTEVGQLSQALADWDHALELDDGSHTRDWTAKRDQLKQKINQQEKK